MHALLTSKCLNYFVNYFFLILNGFTIHKIFVDTGSTSFFKHTKHEKFEIADSRRRLN